jgi:hypothetical protein
MTNTKLDNNEFDFSDGSYPSVFKKLDPTDVRVSPFKSHKKWMLYSGSATSSAMPLIGIYTPVLPALGTELTYNDASNVDGTLQSVTYYSAKHLYGPVFQTASILSIPMIRVGEGIKPASFTFTSSVSGSYYSLPNGDIADSGIADSAIITGSVRFYEGFNQFFDANQIPYSEWMGIEIVPGVPTTTGRQKPVGLAAKFAGAGYFETPLNGRFDRYADYAVSFWVSASNATFATQLIMGKVSQSNTPTSPFIIELTTANQIQYTVAGTTTFKTQITSSTALDTTWNHVVCQKSGSWQQLWVNGVLESTTSSSLLMTENNPSLPTTRIDNINPLKIGGYGANSSNLTGFLDEVRVFNQSLTQAQISALNNRSEGGSFLQTKKVGKVHASQGIVVLSSADYRVSDLLNTPYTASYRSTVTRHELSALVKVKATDFNLSTNLTLTEDDDSTYLSMVTGSAFTPYITTIGLYDDVGQLLAIGKLAQPIHKRLDVDMNFLMRLDLDRTILLKD